MIRLLCFALAFTLVPTSHADDQTQQPTIETRTIEYEEGGVTFRGYLARPSEIDGDAPGVLVIHEWWGLNDFAKTQARRLAELGYVAFAADMYGDGRTTSDPQQAGEWSGQVRSDRRVLRDRADAALEVLEDIEGVDDDRLAVIGYCFGGTVAVELGYDEDDVAAVVSFHGNPMPAREVDEDIDARFLILHGAADTLVPEARLTAFSEALKARGVQYRIIRYEGAKHSFTNPAADGLGMDAVGYDEQAARQSWRDMRRLFDEVFEPSDE